MKSKRQGFTLAEMLVFTALGSMLLAAIGTMFFFSTRSMIALGNYNDLNQKSRNALDVLSRDIRSAQSVTAFSTNFLVFKDYDNGVLSFSNNPSAQEFIRTKNGVSDVLLTECDYLSFSVYQRNPSNGFTFYPTADPSLVKLVDVSWRCSRKILGGKVNTESVQTAKIVIRN